MISFAREALYDVVAEYGPAIGSDPDQLEQRLREHCPECPQEIFVLVHAARLNIPARLETLIHTPASPTFLPALVRQLGQSSGLGEAAATWGVQTWGMALGVLAEATTAPPHSSVPGVDQTQIRVGPSRAHAPAALAPLPVASPDLPPPPSSRRLPMGLIIGFAALVIVAGAIVGLLLALRQTRADDSGSTLAASTTVSLADVPSTSSPTTTVPATTASGRGSSSTTRKTTTTTKQPTTTTTAPLVLLSNPTEMTCASYGATVTIPAGWAPLGIQKNETEEISRFEVNHPNGSFFVCQTEDGPYWSKGFDPMAYQLAVEKKVKAKYPDLATESMERTTFAGVPAVRWTYTATREYIPTRFFNVAFRLRADLPPTVLAYRYPQSVASETEAQLEAIVASFRTP